ncbi:GNAT family N-acetyltransferase [Myroides indicus]|uniref:Ribosomal protein S18 acetylase RimI-like enzyme n=1 Tax=Myroides indicus TaxID=1323422 RepID=A0A4R7EQF6_9FLAO|nr:GNAT family N-acetyltransferase [Myroides indicus]TDS54565.1 ribosomal protein S18 acetylase RimI-like enzyme [Myroides indicus]
MSVTIRRAKKTDFDIVPKLMLQAMEDIVFSFIQKNDIEEAIYFLTRLFQQPSNLYSYENTFVAINEENEILGSITGYNGDYFHQLQQPVLDVMNNHYNNPTIPESETNGGEFYLDTIAVSPMSQGKGIGTQLLKYVIDYARDENFQQIGLLVDIKNPDAKKLYEKLGFKQDHKITLAGSEYDHLSILF